MAGNLCCTGLGGTFRFCYIRVGVPPTSIYGETTTARFMMPSAPRPCKNAGGFLYLLLGVSGRALGKEYKRS